MSQPSDYQNVVQGLYISLLGRPADPAGLLSFETALANTNAQPNFESIVNAPSGALYEVLKTFTDSTEVKSAFTGKTDFEIVESTYLNAFGRPASPKDSAYWTSQITTGALTPAQAALAIANSAANSANPDPFDSTAFSYKVKAASYFTKAVDDLNPGNSFDGNSFASFGKSVIANTDFYSNALTFEDAIIAAHQVKPATQVTSVVDPNIATIETAYLAVTGSPAPPDQLASLTSQWQGKPLDFDTVANGIVSNDKSNEFGLDPTKLSNGTTQAMFETQTINSIFEHLYNRAPTWLELDMFSHQIEGEFSSERYAGHNPSAKDVVYVLGQIVDSRHGRQDKNGSQDQTISQSKISAATALSQGLPTPLYDQIFATQIEQKFLNSITSTTSASDITAQVKLILSDIKAANIAPHQETQIIANMNSNSGQLVDLGKNPSFFAPVVTPNGLPGFSATQLTYTVDKNGLLTFQGSLVSALTPEQKATIIDNFILKNDTSHVVFFNDGGNGYAVRNDGDHFVQLTDYTITGGNGGGTQTGVDGLVKLVGIDYSAGSSGGGGVGGLCDIRLKKNINFFRTTENGIKLYEFAYFGDEQRFIGPMAQDLMGDERFAHSVRKNANGFYQVDFSAIGIEHLASKEMIDAGMRAVQTRQKWRDG